MPNRLDKVIPDTLDKITFDLKHKKDTEQGGYTFYEIIEKVRSFSSKRKVGCIATMFIRNTTNTHTVLYINPTIYLRNETDAIKGASYTTYDSCIVEVLDTGEKVDWKPTYDELFSPEKTWIILLENNDVRDEQELIM
jgi:hypothetical protein